MNGSSNTSPSSHVVIKPPSTLVTAPESGTSTGELNLSGLTDEDTFESEAAWLNDILASSSDSSSSNLSLAALDSQLARTLGLLEIATHDTSVLVDSTIDKISRSVPRLTFDLQLMRENALLLRFTLDGIRKRGAAAGEDSEVGKVMERLKVLDLVKQRMEAARDVLREAESWSTLESEVTGLVGEQAYAKAAERLEEAARSMVVFQNTAEYEGRRALMVSLQNQLEASLSTSLVKAINSRDVKTCKTFYSIFGQIQRDSEFTSYYFGSRRSNLVDVWSSAKLADIAESSGGSQFPLSTTNSPQIPASSPVKFTVFLDKFYSELHTLLSEERTYLPAIFPFPAPTLSAFIQTTLEGLSPSFHQRLSAVSDSYGAQVLPELITAYKATEEFAVLVEGIVAKLVASSSTTLGSPASSLPQSSPTAIKKERRLSKRMSISKRSISSRSISISSTAAPSLQSTLDAADEIVRPWELALYEPFLDWQADYAELERSFLASEIAKQLAGQPVIRQISSSEEAGSGPRALWNQTSAIFSLAEESIGRALSFTHGYAAVGLTEVLDDQLAAFLDEKKGELKRLRKGSLSGQGTSGVQVEEETVLEGLEYSQEDWGAFQYGLRLLDTCRSISDRLTAFEGKLKGRLTVLAQTMKESRTDPTYRIPGTTKGAITMLRQSTLNSTDLVALLEPLEKSSDSVTASSPHSNHLLLPRTRMAVKEFTRATQTFLHDTILGPLLVHLSEYATLPAWTVSADQQRAGGRGAFDLAIPTFSMSPTETISRVGEGLFNLPRLFEVYADDDALAFSIETLPFIDSEALQALQAESPSIPPATPRHSSVRMGSFDASNSVSMGAIPPPGSSPSRPRKPSLGNAMPLPQLALSAETVIATWLSSLTLSTLSNLSTSILPSINRLSKNGAAQLASDLSYISNVARALDVEPPEEVEAWREASEVEEKAKLDELRIDKGILERVARIRGWRRAH